MKTFNKMHGLGNDFVILDQREGGETLSTGDIIRIADRRRGVGCDQLIHMKPPRSPDTDVFLDMYNRDGSSLQSCGNGSRCIARVIMDESGRSACVLETVAGKLFCRKVADGMVEIDMGKPRLGWKDIPLAEERDTLHLGIQGGLLPDPVSVSMGNPHTIFFVDQVESFDIATLGSQVERHVLFPERTNVEFAQILSPEKIRVRVWERGTGITQACGSGACATIVAAVRRGLTSRKVEIILDGGSLFLEWRSADDHVLMTGPAEYVYQGQMTA
jgi:diaminopimelate epimerase